jgi:hypothetical protein
VATRSERAGLKLLEHVADIAADIAAVRVFLLYGIDPLQAIPLDVFRTTTTLHKVRRAADRGRCRCATVDTQKAGGEAGQPN